MTILFMAGVLFCLMYWFILILATGVTAGQNWIWLFFAAVFFVNMLAAFMYRRDPSRVPLWLITALHTMAISMMAVLLVTGILIASALHEEPERNLDYVMVLGAETRPDGQVSESLRRRLDAAVAYAAENPQTRFILSGGKAEDGRPSEAEIMAGYLTAAGIAPGRLMLEIQSKNTYENIIYSAALLKRVEGEVERKPHILPKSPAAENIIKAEAKPVRIGVLTNGYHLYRAQHIAAKQLGRKVSGIPAGSPVLTLVHAYFRECLALLKDKFLGRL